MGGRKKVKNPPKARGWLSPRDEREKKLRRRLCALASLQGTRARDLLYDAIEEYLKNYSLNEIEK